MLQKFQAFFREQNFAVNDVERAASEHQSKFSPHSSESVRFLSEIVGMTGKWLNVLRDGLRLEFTQIPGSYFEHNNRSALENLPFVQRQVKEWLDAGFVDKLTQPAWCNSPLSVVQKYDAVQDVLKERLVLDLSRHANTFIPDKHVKLEDLSVSEHLLEVSDYMASFDLKNQFFHVKLHPDMYRFFGFSCTDTDGSICYYQFKVLIYGCKPAVHIVTRLLMPVKSFLHTLGIKISIYIDDGRVAAASAAETKAKLDLSLLVLQLSGWNIQWKKCVLTPTHRLAHLGFVTDTVSMQYSVDPAKITVLRRLMQDVLQNYFSNLPVSARQLATILGKLISMQRSHGDILFVMSRSSQHLLGSHVIQHGWNSNVYITPAIVTEFSFVLNVLDSANGQPIYTAVSVSHTVDLMETAERILAVQHSEKNFENLFVSDASQTHAFVYRADGSFEYVRDFEFTAGQSSLSSGHRELLAIKLALISDRNQFAKFAHGKIYWQTDSQCVFNFLRRGSRIPAIQADVVKIKQLASELLVKIVPVWTPREQSRLFLADLGSKFSNSTDEWSADREQLRAVFEYFQFYPTVDAFASVHNRICDQFFSLAPQTGSSGVNFFAQTLSASQKYFCCPPVSLIVSCFKKLCTCPGVQAVLVVPAWSGQAFWPFLFNGSERQPCIRDILRFHTGFVFANTATSKVFSRNPRFDMLALLIVV